MAVIAQTNGVLTASAPVALTRTTMTATDTLSFQKGSNQVLMMINPTGSVVNVTITGAAPQSLSPDGYGGTVSTAGGKVVEVAANGATYLKLDNIWAFLGDGTATLTGGTGLFAVVAA